jgi:hypothetical protein
VIETFIAVVWIVYLSDLFVAAVPGAWTLRGRRGAMRAGAGPDVQLAGGFALMRLPVLPWEHAFAVRGTALPEEARAARVAAVYAAAGPVAAAASTLAAVLLFGLPVVRAGWLTPKAWVLAVGAAWLTTMVLLARAWRRVHGRRMTIEAWIATALTPVGASRAGYALAWRCLDDVHPIEAAALLCDDDELLRVARLWTYDAPQDRDGVRRLLAPRGLAGRLDAPPPIDVDGSPQYCPRCGHGYAAFAEACTDCDVALVARAVTTSPPPAPSAPAARTTSGCG